MPGTNRYQTQMHFGAKWSQRELPDLLSPCLPHRCHLCRYTLEQNGEIFLLSSCLADRCHVICKCTFEGSSCCPSCLLPGQQVWRPRPSGLFFLLISFLQVPVVLIRIDLPARAILINNTLCHRAIREARSSTMMQRLDISLSIFSLPDNHFIARRPAGR